MKFDILKKMLLHLFCKKVANLQSKAEFFQMVKNKA